MNLPEPVITVIREASVANYVTLTRDLRPIDTPVLCFPGEGFKSIDLATGLAYPAKAERARRNAKVGMLIEAAEGGPVVAIAGIAAVRDADLQANVNRYLTEAAQVLSHNPDGSLARQAVWYWTRILIEVTPADVLWWDSARAMDGAPHRWSAGDAAVYPASDPAPPGRVSEAASWQPSDWRALADAALMRGAPGHVSVVDAAGWPRVAPVRAAGRSDAGFVLEVAAGLPWTLDGAACLTFGGIETFLGTLEAGEMRVERALPVFPMTEDPSQLWQPEPHTRAELMRRLEAEIARRGQTVPHVPERRPAPSAAHVRRLARLGIAPAVD